MKVNIDKYRRGRWQTALCPSILCVIRQDLAGLCASWTETDGHVASPPRQQSAESSKTPTPSAEQAPNLPKVTTQHVEDDKEHEESREHNGNSSQEDAPATLLLPQRPAPRNHAQQAQNDNSTPVSPLEQLPDPAPPPVTEEDLLTVPISGHSSQALQSITHANNSGTPALGLSPTLTEILMPFSDIADGNEAFVGFQMPTDFQLPLPQYPMLDPDFLANDMVDSLGELGDINDHGRSAEEVQHIWADRYHTPTSSNSSGSSDEHTGPWQGPVNYLYTQPYFAQDSPEMLTFRFDKLTCGILSVMDGPTENPWRSLIWPLALQSPALYHAVTAMTAFHSSTDVPSLRLVGHEHKQASIRYIQEGIRDNSMTDQTAIATALALGFSESWDQHTATGNTHIKGAQALVKRALGDHRRNQLFGTELSRLKFLCNAWVYMDVIARLTSVDSDESNDFDNTFLFTSDAPDMVMGDPGNPGFGIDFGMPIDARLDPLMGCANTLFPIIGRVANLVRKVCRSQKNSPGVISQANDLKLALETWEPPAFIEPPEDPTSQVQHTLQTAEAYRWATLLHLHQSVPELPSFSSAEMAQKVMTYLATVPLASRTVIVQIYPLMVAGCEASEDEDRDWVRARWAAMGARMRIGVIDKSATVTEEVWRRKDAYEAQPSSQRKLVATAELHPVRQKGAPLKRTHSGFEDSDPGRSGVVFSWADGDGDCASHWAVAAEKVKRAPRGAPNMTIGGMDPAYTVRGHLHWVGVMWDWGWEGTFTADSLKIQVC